MGTSVGSAKLATKARLSDLHKRQLFIDPRIEADSPPPAHFQPFAMTFKDHGFWDFLGAL